MSRYKRILEHLENGKYGRARTAAAFLHEKEVEFIDRFRCSDCGSGMTAARGFMVCDEVWKAAGMDYKGFLHLPCLEKRLGRPLALADFTDVPINDNIRFAYKMGKSHVNS